MKKSTIFTQIINREIKSYILYEDELVISFLDIFPFTQGHIIVATKQQITDINSISEDIFLHLFRIVKRLSVILFKIFKPQGLNILNNNGAVAGQTIFHFHVHLIPRFCSEEINFIASKSKIILTKEYFKNIQKKIIENFNDFSLSDV